MGASKIIYGGQTILDLTADTVTEDDLPAGVTAHNKSGEAIEGNSKFFRRYFKKTGWYRIAKIFTGDVSFILSIIKNYNTTPDDIQNFLIDVSVSPVMIHITQLSNSVRIRNVEKIRIVSENNANNTNKYLDIYYNGNTENLIHGNINLLNIFSNSFTNKFQIYTEEIFNPEITNENVIYTYEISAALKGMVADYAIADKNGNDIPETYERKKTASFVMRSNGYCLIFEVAQRAFSAILFVVKSEGASIGLAAAFSIEAACSADGIQRVYVNQLGCAGNDSAIGTLSLKYDNNKWSVYLEYHGIDTLTFDVHNISTENFTFVLADYGAVPVGSYFYDAKFKNIGIIADKAMTVDPGVFINHSVVKSYGVSTNDNIDAAINDAYNNTAGNSYFEFTIAVGQPNLTLGGGIWYFKGYKSDDNWGWITGETYFASQVKMKNYKMNGAWSGWIQDSFNRHNPTINAEITTTQQVNDVLQGLFVDAGDHSCYEGVLNVTAAGQFELGGGEWYISGYRSNTLYGYQEAKKYETTGLQYYARSMYNGTWTAWKNMSPS